MRARYLAALKGWAVVGVVPPAFATFAIAALVSYGCRNIENDCSWGFEYLFVIPVLIVFWFLMAPVAVGAFVKAVHPARSVRAGVVTFLLSPFALWLVIASFATAGPVAFVVALVFVAVAVPAVVAAVTGE